MAGVFTDIFIQGVAERSDVHFLKISTVFQRETVVNSALRSISSCVDLVGFWVVALRTQQLFPLIWSNAECRSVSMTTAHRILIFFICFFLTCMGVSDPSAVRFLLWSDPMIPVIWNNHTTDAWTPCQCFVIDCCLPSFSWSPLSGHWWRSVMSHTSRETQECWCWCLTLSAGFQEDTNNLWFWCCRENKMIRQVSVYRIQETIAQFDFFWL